MTVQTVLEFLQAGETREEILHQYPSLEPEDLDACLEYASHQSPAGTSSVTTRIQAQSFISISLRRRT
jgi:uncharacterized protein (DUF433 family)